jgi:odorant receptor
MYLVVYVLISYSLVIGFMTLTGIDGTLFESCLYIAGQFQIVEQKVINLLSETKPLTLEENRKIKEKLIDIVKHQNQCIKLTKKLSQIYEIIVFNDFTSASIVMGLCSVNIIMNDGMDKQIFVCYLIAAVLQLYGYCKNGSSITESSAKVAVAIYNLEWYKYDKQVKYLVQTILMRSQKTTEMKIPFHSVSMATLAKVSHSHSH